jgi:hypothetical protein
MKLSAQFGRCQDDLDPGKESAMTQIGETETSRTQPPCREDEASSASPGGNAGNDVSGAPGPLDRADIALLGGLGLVKLLIHLPVLHRYGYHHDELYFIACGQHPSFGYVDHAPLVPWIARLATTLFGESLVGLRILSTLAGAAAVVLLGLLVRRMGGGRFAQVLACVAMIVAPVYLRTGNLLCILAFEPILWLACFYLLVRLIQEEDQRLWVWLGLVAGLGLTNKHSMLFFGFGLTAGLLLTPLRRSFRSPWLYAGGAVAFLIFLPNLIWQARNGWPTFVFLLSLNSKVMEDISSFQFVAGQFLYLAPLSALVWIPGLVYLLFSRHGRPYRILGWIYVAVFLLLLVVKSKIYYLAPAYPPLLAAGGIAIERLARRRQLAWLPPATVALVALGGLALAPVSLPALSIDATDRFVDTVTFGAFDNIYELTGDLHGMFGWPERVDAVTTVYDSLSPAEKEKTMLFAADYGNAGVVDHLGKQRGLPRAVSFDKTYWLWGYPDHPVETVIGVGFSVEFLEQIYDEVEVAASVELENVNPYQTPFVVTLCRRPKIPMDKVWPQVRPW